MLEFLVFTESKNHFETFFKKTERKNSQNLRNTIISVFRNFLKKHLVGIFTMSVSNVKEWSVKVLNRLDNYL